MYFHLLQFNVTDQNEESAPQVEMVNTGKDTHILPKQNAAYNCQLVTGAVL